MLFRMVGIGAPVILLALFATNIAFQQWIELPTVTGAKLRNRIRGSGWYLGVAERQQLAARHRPEAAPERCAELLSYACALHVGNGWARRFADALSAVQMSAAQSSWHNRPDDQTYLCSGDHPSTFPNLSQGFSSGLGAAITSSSVAPGSSSFAGVFGDEGGW